MPVYVYKNLTTGETFEVQQRITESAWTEHPATGDPVKRIVQPVGIAFKGSGFYVTDSRTSSKKPSADKAGSNDASAKSDAPTKGDASTSASDGPASKADSTPSAAKKDATKKETKKDSKA
ncbi:MAG: hypothetical protein U5J97_03710 [Trueperaceae bacterium]|nr:hypothetical protein [Trueperaceae bacterium]